MSNRSVEVQDANRAGRAPYNFVPLPEQVREWTSPPDGDRYHNDLESGEIEFTMQALTRFFIRGMWSMPEYRDGNVLKDQSEPFAVNRQLRLPGSSIRGMIRTLVEILSCAPLDPINDQQLFFRPLGAEPQNTRARSYEPQARSYKNRILSAGAPAAKPAHLYHEADRWVLKPVDPVLYRVDDPAADEYNKHYKDFTEMRDGQVVPKLGYWPIRFTPPMAGELVETWNLDYSLTANGWIICSGFMQGKLRQWIISRLETGAEIPLEVIGDEVQAYREGGITYWMEKDGKAFDYRKTGHDPMPCFFIRDAQGIAFGHTPYFRLPYKATTDDRNQLHRADQNDMARAIFGSTARRGRMSFEDGILTPRQEFDRVVEPEGSPVLGEPKPSTYQHYLVQGSELQAQTIHWDDARARLRGHKLYWHRPNTSWPPAATGKEGVQSKLRPARAGLAFQCRIGYENLRCEELGSLLTALELPPHCGHRLGMGKPLGLGSFQTSVTAIRKINRQRRYRSLGDMGHDVVDSEKMKKDFAQWYLGDRTKTWTDLWKVERLADLEALLTCEGLPDNWENRTRYLEIGARNEYLQPSRRRPLPPASQVLEGGSAIPDE